jgi:hypothetical protein
MARAAPLWLPSPPRAGERGGGEGEETLARALRPLTPALSPAAGGEGEDPRPPIGRVGLRNYLAIESVMPAPKGADAAQAAVHRSAADMRAYSTAPISSQAPEGWSVI